MSATSWGFSSTEKNCGFRSFASIAPAAFRPSAWRADGHRATTIVHNPGAGRSVILLRARSLHRRSNHALVPRPSRTRGSGPRMTAQGAGRENSRHARHPDRPRGHRGLAAPVHPSSSYAGQDPPAEVDTQPREYLGSAAQRLQAGGSRGLPWSDARRRDQAGPVGTCFL